MEILSVLGIIAIIAVAGLVIYLLAGLIISIIDKKNVKLFNVEETKPNQEKEQQLLLQDSAYELNLDEEEAKEEVGETIDLDAADREKAEIEAQKAALAEREEEVKSDPLSAEEVTEEGEDEEESLDEMYQKLIADINAEAAQEEPEEVKEEVAEEEKVEEPVEEEVEEPEEVEEVVEEEPAPVDEVAEEEVVDTEKEDMQKEIDALRAQLQAEQAQKDELAKKLEEKPEVEVVETESLEDLQARLAVLNERLAESEKQLKANKKEYLPLARIKKHLEADKTKLRRKEAVVAKQKVMLFGVNNYVVDPEKEQKLSEDLDVLDALRLSVQHCEDVMKTNEDRYPILENTNKILTKQVADLKADVADLEARIAKLNGEGDQANAE